MKGARHPWAAASFLAAILFSGAAAARDLKSQPQLDAISAGCKTPKEWLTLDGAGEVHLVPAPDARYQQVDCVLKQLKKHHHMKLGFVGNEQAPSTEQEQE